jgi:hypothetical protein
MRRREFIAELGAAALATGWTLMARAERVRRVGVLTLGKDEVVQTTMATFREELAKLGWVEDRKLAHRSRPYGCRRGRTGEPPPT